MLTENQATTMLSMQAAMNRRVDPQWVEAAYPYLRAVVVEAAEAMEHHGWKWWKHQACDMPQVQMEVIDIWHFLLSDVLLAHQGNEKRALEQLLREARIDAACHELAFDGRHYPLDSLNLLDKLQLLSATAAAGRAEIALFGAILSDCDMDWAELFRQYTGKNVLNFFRQDNGYKEGNYRKNWLGREDNEHLVDIMQSLDAQAEDFQQQLYAALDRRYRQACSQA